MNDVDTLTSDMDENFELIDEEIISTIDSIKELSLKIDSGNEKGVPADASNFQVLSSCIETPEMGLRSPAPA